MIELVMGKSKFKILMMLLVTWSAFSYAKPDVPPAALPASGRRVLPTTPSLPVYSIHVRCPEECRYKFFCPELPYLKGANTKRYFEKNPYAKFQPAPFQYEEDVTEAAKVGAKPFVVAGVNCDETIKKAPTITGVPVKTLSLRARGEGGFGSFVGRERARPEWKGVCLADQRGSVPGFLSPAFFVGGDDTPEKRKIAENALQDLLVKDNQTVRRLGLTHQQIAEPLLAAIGDMILPTGEFIHDIIGAPFEDEGDEGTISSSRFFQHHFEFQGNKYFISMHQMGGYADNIDDKKKARRSFIAEASGWTGKGVQGSFFNDELFSNKIFEICNKDNLCIHTDGLTPHLIYRYGFYQGGEYRVPPETIAAFFGLKPKGNPWAACPINPR